jgi:hypothetical protein
MRIYYSDSKLNILLLIKRKWFKPHTWFALDKTIRHNKIFTIGLSFILDPYREAFLALTNGVLAK